MSGNNDRTRRRGVLETAATGLIVGASGCLGLLDGETGTEDDGQRGDDASLGQDGTPGGDGGDSGDGSDGETGGGEDGEDTVDGEVRSGQLIRPGPTVEVEEVASGLWSPTVVAAPPSEDRLYAAEMAGRVEAIDLDGDPGSIDEEREEGDRQSFLNLRGKVVQSNERGVNGLAFHPDYAENGRFYVRYSTPVDDSKLDVPQDVYGTPDHVQDVLSHAEHVERVSEFRVENGQRADPGSERVLLEVPMPLPRPGNNGGDVAFGPDGYLYVTVGDGAVTYADPPEGWWHGGSSQNTKTNLLGGVLRIDVDSEGENRPYGIPDDNPLAGVEGHRGEYYAWGFQDPKKLTFDDGQLYVSEPGRMVHRVEKGGNYGWAGIDCSLTRSDPPSQECPEETPDHVRGREMFRDPVIEYPAQHPDEDGMIGLSISGGEVYRGDGIPPLQGQYVFGDYKGGAHSKYGAHGKLFVASPAGKEEPVHPFYRERDLWPIRRVTAVDSAGADAFDGRTVTRVDAGPDGELYVLTHRRKAPSESGPGGAIYRLVPHGSV